MRKWMNVISRDKKGFSLVELMIVVAVIAILAAIAIPSYLGIQKKAARSEAKANLEGISLVLEGYMAENNDYGAANIYTYFRGGAFGHPGNLEVVAKLGNQVIYEYRVVTTVAPTLAFSIFAIPRTGRVVGDRTIWLDSSGNKGPVGVGW
jgi:prepilin-type N-terminal cleavage/methylation domain-containing protein